MLHQKNVCKSLVKPVLRHIAALAASMTVVATAHGFLGVAVAAGMALLVSTPYGQVQAENPNDPGIREPVLSTVTGQDVRIPFRSQRVERNQNR